MINMIYTTSKLGGWLGFCLPTIQGHFYSLEILVCLRPSWLRSSTLR